VERWLSGGRKGRGEEIRELPVDSILLNPYQPRRVVREEELEELAASIREFGVLQPVLVRPFKRGYELVAGERRLRASKRLGKSTIPAIVRRLTDEEAALLCLVENLQRQDLGFFEEAEGYQRALEEFSLTQEQLAARVGKSQSTIANKLRLLRLPGEVRRAAQQAGLTERHVRALLRLGAEEAQLRVVREIEEQGLTVRDTEELVNRLAQSEGEPEEGRRRHVVRVFKDLRIFVNTFREAVETLRKAGVEAEMSRQETDEYIEIRVRIPREQ